jgi:myxalamid-type polyketide synthase MxaE and MxaD
VWSQTGVMRGEGGRRQLDELQRQGIGGFAPSQALALLGDALRQDMAHLLVMPVDWRAMRKSLGAREVALLNELLADAATPAADAPLVESSDPAERRRALDRAVRDVVGRVLKLTPAKIDARKPLGTMGLTSLMALELRNRLEPLHGKPLSATLAWNYPTVDALVAFLAGDHEPAAAPAAPEAVAPVLDAAVAELSDEDAARLLRKRR